MIDMLMGCGYESQSCNNFLFWKEQLYYQTMKPKVRYHTEDFYTISHSSRYQGENSPNHPVKSPSPDKRSANIIVSTRTPEMEQLHPNHFYVQRQYRACSCCAPSEKPFTTNTPPSKHDHIVKIQETQPSNEDQRYGGSQSGSRVRNTRIEIVAESSPEDFSIRQSQINEINQSESRELDYLKLLKSKQETIKELKEIIEMIKRNNTSLEEVEDYDRGKELQSRLHQLNAENRELKIENQHLLNVIEKGKKSQPPLKDDILQRQIRELKQTVRSKELQIIEISNDYQEHLSKLRQDLSKIESQNQSLIRLLREKEESLANSSLSIKSNSQKLTLSKIKEQHNENLKLMRQNFYGQIKDIEGNYEEQLAQISKKINILNEKLIHLQNINHQLVREREKIKARELDKRERQKNQEIQSLMLQKYSKYENEIIEHKKTNERLIQELIKANRTIDQLKQQCQTYYQQITVIRQQPAQTEDLNRLKEDKNTLSKRVNALEIQNLSLKNRFDEFSHQKNLQITELQKKIELILVEYENHSKEQKSKYEMSLQQLKLKLNKSDSKQKQLIDLYEKDKMDTEQKVKMAIDIYNKENEALKAAVNYKNNEINQLLQEIQTLKNKLSTGQINEKELNTFVNECDALRKRCSVLQQQTTHLNNELKEMDRLLKEKDEKILRSKSSSELFEQQKEHLNKIINEVQIKNNDLTVRLSRRQLEIIELTDKVALLQKSKEKEQLVFQLTTVQQELSVIAQKNNQLSHVLFQKDREIQQKKLIIGKLEGQIKDKQLQISQGQPLQQDLQDLKKAVCECFMQLSTTNQKEIVEEFYKLNHNYEIKLEENLRILKQLEEIKTQLAEEFRQRQILNEKIHLLEHNASIYERQIKERRQLYDQLLQQKGKVEKEALLAKKIKIQHTNIDNNFKGNLSEITSRIDRLLDLERQRNRQINNIIIKRVSPERR